MSQEKLFQEMKRHAAANGRNLNDPDLNTRWFNLLAVEAEVKRLFPGIDAGDTPGPGPSVNVGETIRQSDLLKLMRKIATEQNLNLTERSDFEHAEGLAKECCVCGKNCIRIERQ
jgi:hypothetical protein